MRMMVLLLNETYILNNNNNNHHFLKTFTPKCINSCVTVFMYLVYIYYLCCI